jgi:hypothetical protein
MNAFAQRHRSGLRPSAEFQEIAESRPRERGTMLLIAIAVLTLLSIIAVTFAALMRLERKATENFRNAAGAEMLVDSGTSAVIAMLRGGALWDGHTDLSNRQSPWLYGSRTSRGDLRYGGLEPLDRLQNPENSSLTLELGASYAGAESKDRFRTKVIDCNSQIYLNGEQDTLAQMLDNLGQAIRNNPELKYNPLYSGPRMTGKQITGREILRFRSRLPGRRFQSKSQLQDLIGGENYKLLADFVTAEAWVNPHTVRSTDGRQPVRLLLDGDDALLTSVNNQRQANPNVEGAPRVSFEPRAPINVNTAPREVLIACLAGIGGRRAFPYTEVQVQQFENMNRGVIDVDGTLPPTNEEISLVQVPVWVYSTPLTVEQATDIADRIISSRKTRPFKVWRSSDLGEPGFEDFIDALPETVFPPASSITVINPRDPGGRYKSPLLSGNEGSGRIFGLGHDPNERGARRAAGLPVSNQNAWYFDMMRDTLKANFNPNARLNKFNPNLPAYVTVDKANLVKLGNNGTDRNDVVVGHTTEFCFDSRGIYEVTAFAEMLVGESQAALETYAETKRRSVVRIFDTIQHTTQRQFERPFNEGGLASFRDREYVTSYPDSMDALEPDIFFGSQDDGRIELSGATDARLQAVRPELRQNQFVNSSNLRLAETFRFRQNGAELRTTVRRNGRRDPQVNEQLREVLDADFASDGVNFTRHYGRNLWSTGNISDEDDPANISEPQIGTAADNGDYQPDGLHMGFERVSRNGTRILRYPANSFRSRPGFEGQMEGRNNTTGNLPYYQGGFSCWLKLEHDGADPIFCGILKATQVIRPVGQNVDDSEGTQTFVWKNTNGEIRITRLYYHQAFQRGGLTNAVPLIGDGEDLENEDVIADPRKTWARTDVVVDVRDWKAHEWHHLAVEWNDEADGDRIRVVLDGEALNIVTNHNLGFGRFCALNEFEPSDEIQIGGVHRQQSVDNEGVFKFGTNVSARSMQQRDPTVKKIPLNGTIDEFRTFFGFYDRGSEELGYFTRETGRYVNQFEVPFPEGIQRLRLRSLNWTVYPPKLYAGLGVRWNPGTDFVMRARNVDNSGAIEIRDAGGDAVLNQNISGRWLYKTGNLLGEVGRLGYEVEMRGAFGEQRYGDRIVSSPVFDDVTLTYYLPSARVLISEEME